MLLQEPYREIGLYFYLDRRWVCLLPMTEHDSYKSRHFVQTAEFRQKCQLTVAKSRKYQKRCR